MSYILSLEVLEFKCDYCHKSLFGVEGALRGNGIDMNYAYCNEDCAKAANERW